ncbi:Rap1a/Tai family immunity protein [Vibrio hibernica]|uniref:Rap1a/Tai family immunity protein n=1 Tax=Vibrio hibernica TaxID=2587465 RepID=UPI0039B04E0A
MKYCVCILALVFSFSALAGWTDGHSLLKALEGQENDDIGYRSGYFDGYVAGVSDLSVDILWCPPQNVNQGQISKIVANYLKAHPESLHKNADLLVVDALKSPFPCKKNS